MRQAGKPDKNSCMLVRKCYRIFISFGLLNVISGELFLLCFRAISKLSILAWKLFINEAYKDSYKHSF